MHWRPWKHQVHAAELTPQTAEGGTVHPQPLTTPDSRDTCPGSTQRAPLFPPPGADAETYRAWLAQAAWPEVVFGARLPASVASR